MSIFSHEIWLLVAESLDRDDLRSLSSANANLHVLFKHRILGYKFLDTVGSEPENAAIDFLNIHTRVDVGVCDHKQTTALDWIAIRGHHTLLPLLLARPRGRRLLENYGALGDTPLIAAARNNQAQMTSALISAGANVNACNAVGETALYWAISNGNLRIVEILLRAKADVTLRYEGGLTALWLAAKGRHLAMSELLLSNGENANVRDASQETMLCWAVKRNSGTYVEMLLNGGASPTLTDKLGREPLTWAAMAGNVEILQKLFPAAPVRTEKTAVVGRLSHGRW
ncbi:hypothetical protein N7476_004632 [Penicillium atrosanguineum]|uniref:Uncharacterized protein n=1 Tax=Penicillium atrosanguineum TaxID=1132637 RepID=A0A9W9PYF1_9EURO|nr:hypothetical protein N7476_004632 [Penicillium atrosanguineum]